MIRAEVTGDTAILYGPFPFAFVRTVAALSGRKVWQTAAQVKFQATPANIRALKRSDHEIEWIDKSGDLAVQEAFEGLPTQHSATTPLQVEYVPKIPLFDHQRKALEISAHRESYALLFEMGLGKSAGLVANAGVLWAGEKLTGVLVVAPKGPHTQWLTEQIPTHFNGDFRCVPWKKKEIEARDFKQIKNELVWFAINIDALRTEKGKEACKAFLAAHKGTSMMVLDESHTIKDFKAQRSKAAHEIGKLARYRRIATGTPIAKNIVDAWSQFGFLDPNILGHRYMTSFRNRYCVLGGWEGKVIVGQKNTEEFYQLIAPHSYRVTKNEALDLPPKIYITKEYEMGEETRKHYKSVKETLLTSLDNGEILDAKNGAVAMGRLQQIVCGHLPREDGSIMKIGRERVDVMLDIIEQRTGPICVWARFIEDRRVILEALEDAGETAVCYAGSDTEREEAKRAFLAGDARIFVSNPKTGGVGLNLMGACQTVIYYSNSFDLIDRVQSEDRVHRIGTKGAVSYFDIVAQKSVDRAILRNLKTKKSILSLSFDEIRMAIKDED
jgi:SNF2 family DNA or RNA helicase